MFSKLNVYESVQVLLTCLAYPAVLKEMYLTASHITMCCFIASRELRPTQVHLLAEKPIIACKPVLYTPFFGRDYLKLLGNVPRGSKHVAD